MEYLLFMNLYINWRLLPSNVVYSREVLYFVLTGKSNIPNLRFAGLIDEFKYPIIRILNEKDE